MTSNSTCVESIIMAAWRFLPRSRFLITIGLDRVLLSVCELHLVDFQHPLIDPISGDAIKPPVVIYHGKCPDGFAAALAAWIRFEGQRDYMPMSHDMPVPDLTERDVYMLDIAFDLQTMQRVEAQASRLVVLDHHQSAATALQTLTCRCGKPHQTKLRVP